MRPKTAAQQAGAIRALGVVRSERLLKALPRLAAYADPVIRQAVAVALGCCEKEPIVAGTLRVPSAEPGTDKADGARSVPATLHRLTAAKEPEVAFAAAYELWRGGGKVESLVPLARAAAGCLPLQSSPLPSPTRGRGAGGEGSAQAVAASIPPSPLTPLPQAGEGNRDYAFRSKFLQRRVAERWRPWAARKTRSD